MHQTDDLVEHPLRELLGLDKELRSIRGSLNVEIAKEIQLEQHIEREKSKLAEIENNPECDDGIRNDIRNRIERLNDDLKARQESIDILKGKLITSIKEMIAKVLNFDTSLAERIMILFREQGITIGSIWTALGMAIGVLVEALLPGGGSTAQSNSG